jgi:hypothetical protein
MPNDSERFYYDSAFIESFFSSLKYESLEDSANLPDPDVIAAEIVEDLQAALAQLTRSRPLSRPLGFAHLCRGFPARSVHRNRLRSEAVTTQKLRDLFSKKPSSSVRSGQRSVLLRQKGVAFAFRTGVCNRSRDRPCEMLHVSAGSTFPAERSQFVSAREKC